jgi:transcription elongation factor Elf1
MATATPTTNAPATLALNKPKGFGPLPCIRCGQEASISLDLDDCSTFRCGECEESFDVCDLREHLARWQRVLAWVDAAPVPAE